LLSSNNQYVVECTQ